MSRVLGVGTYSAYRQDGIVYIAAEGFKPYLQTTVTIEQLPLAIFPPWLALYFDSPAIGNPVLTHFSIEKALPLFPKSVSFVTIQDARGLHNIDIDERQGSDPTFLPLASSGTSFCVFQQIGVQRFVIAKCDAILPAIYYRVYGPTSKDDCEKFVAEHSLSARSVILLKETFKAWINMQPGAERKLIVTGQVSAKKDTVVQLVAAVPGGFNPAIRLLRVDIISTTLTRLPFEAKSLRYDESLAGTTYNAVTVLCDGDAVDIVVDIVQ